MFNYTIDVQPAKDLLTNLRGKAEAVRELIMPAVRGYIAEHMREDVAQFIAPYPDNSAVHPFVFISGASRRWYFAHRRGVGREGTFESQSWDPADNNATWQRTDTLKNGWVVKVNPNFAAFRSGDSTFVITNEAEDELGRTYGDWVYSDHAQPGHVATGWGEAIDDGVERILDQLEYDLTNALSDALMEYQS